MTTPTAINRADSASSSVSRVTTATHSTISPTFDELVSNNEQLFFVTSYSDFDKLAHGPRGSEASHSLYVYRFHPSDGSLVLLNIQGDAKTVMNPAFSRYHPQKNVVYTCTEDCTENGKIFAYKLGADGSLTPLGEPVDAGGTSTCYLTIDKAQKNLLAVNYWDSTLVTIPISKETGEFTGPIKSKYDPKGGKKMVAGLKTDGGVNHSQNDESTIRMRQADPHSHALVLDPFNGTVAYVPCLGKDLVREFFYDREAGSIAYEMNYMPSGLCTGKPDGPRYIHFHTRYNICYIVNELSSTIAVFEVDRQLVKEISDAAKRGENMERFKGRSTLRLIQSIATIPSAFPNEMNTCGRICVHNSGRFVVVSNRGHQSIAIYRVKQKGPKRGELCTVGYFHTRGETPRHFQFDATGQYLIVANQDSDSIAVFSFNLGTGDLKYTGNEYRVPSPNFVCNCPAYQADEAMPEAEEEAVSVVNHGYSRQISDSDCESESSTVPVAQTGSKDLQDKLAQATAEIAKLKKKLEMLTGV